ncbi:MAG: hypothetical protein QNK15_04060 [Cycloclasticus sp.]|nr:hypothetical protein [Cycloclasticus sp.]
MSINRLPMLTGVGSPSDFGCDLVSSAGTEQFELSDHTEPAVILAYLERGHYWADKPVEAKAINNLS